MHLSSRVAEVDEVLLPLGRCQRGRVLKHIGKTATQTLGDHLLRRKLVFGAVVRDVGVVHRARHRTELLHRWGLLKLVDQVQLGACSTAVMLAAL